MFESKSPQDKQTEMFGQFPQTPQRPQKTKFSLGKVNIALSYENTLLLSIGLVVLLIICYALGVERGKSLAQLKDEKIHLKQEQVQKLPVKRSPQPKEKKIRVKFAAHPSLTIQVATFRSVASVKQEIERLKNNGYRPFVIGRGRFSEICIGSYRDRLEASQDLKELRKSYADCFLRNK